MQIISRTAQREGCRGRTLCKRAIICRGNLLRFLIAAPADPFGLLAQLATKKRWLRQAPALIARLQLLRKPRKSFPTAYYGPFAPLCSDNSLIIPLQYKTAYKTIAMLYIIDLLFRYVVTYRSSFFTKQHLPYPFRKILYGMLLLYDMAFMNKQHSRERDMSGSNNCEASVRSCTLAAKAGACLSHRFLVASCAGA